MPASNDRIAHLRALLRARTRSAHQAIDHHPLLAPLSRPAPILDDYARGLAALHGPQAALETLLAPHVPLPRFPPRLPDLAADLASLGRDPWPLRVPLPEIWGEAEIIGLMYVIEGANLGGAVLALHLRKHLPGGTPMRFLEGAGGQARWERFWDFAARLPLAGDAERTASAAVATFALYKAHLDCCLQRDAIGDGDTGRAATFSPAR